MNNHDFSKCLNRIRCIPLIMIIHELISRSRAPFDIKQASFLMTKIILVGRWKSMKVKLSDFEMNQGYVSG